MAEGVPDQYGNQGSCLAPLHPPSSDSLATDRAFQVCVLGRSHGHDSFTSVQVFSSSCFASADEQFTGSMETNVAIGYDGKIRWDTPAITKSSCKVDVSYFPFDGQQCRLTFGSWTYNGNQIDILNAMDTGDLTDFVENVEWEVLGMPSKKNIITYGCCSEPYPDVTYTLLLKRRASFYIFNLLVPCIMISFLAPLGFYLPADSGEKVSLGVTVLLALTVFQLMVAESMPPAENVPLIGTYCLFSDGALFIYSIYLYPAFP